MKTDLIIIFDKIWYWLQYYAFLLLHLKLEGFSVDALYYYNNFFFFFYEKTHIAKSSVRVWYEECFFTDGDRFVFKLCKIRVWCEKIQRTVAYIIIGIENHIEAAKSSLLSLFFFFFRKCNDFLLTNP